MKYVFLMVAIVAEVVATALLKSSDGFTKLAPSVGTVVGYGIAFYLLSLTLRTMPTGMAYAVWSGVGIVLTALVAWLIHGQRPDAPAVGGMLLIIAGVVVMNVFSQTSAHAPEASTQADAE